MDVGAPSYGAGPILSVFYAFHVCLALSSTECVYPSYVGFSGRCLCITSTCVGRWSVHRDNTNRLSVTVHGHVYAEYGRICTYSNSLLHIV